MGHVWSKKKNSHKHAAAAKADTNAAAANSGSAGLASSSAGDRKNASPRTSIERRNAGEAGSGDSGFFSNPSAPSAAPGGDNTAETVDNTPESPDLTATVRTHLAEDDVRNVLVNQWELAKALLVLIGEICTSEFGTPEFWEAVDAKHKAAADVIAVLRDQEKLRKWVAPLPSVQTGSILVGASALVRAYDAVQQKMEQLRPQQPATTQNKAQFRESAKLLLQSYFQFYCACELLLPNDVNTTVLETAKLGEEVLNFALGNLPLPDTDITQVSSDGYEYTIPISSAEEYFEAQVRKFATQAIKLARAANTRGIQQQSYDNMRQFNDASFTVVRAARAMAVMGHRAVVDPTDADAKNSLFSLAKGLAAQFEKLSSIAMNNAAREPNFALGPDTIELYCKLYDAASKDLQDNIEDYSHEHMHNANVKKAGDRVVTAVEIVKKMLEAPDSTKLFKSCLLIFQCVEQLTSQVYALFGPRASPAVRRVMLKHGVVKDQLMLSLLSALQHTLQFVLSGMAKLTYFPVLPPELGMVNSARGLLGALSVMFNACVFVLHHCSQNVDEEGLETPAEELVPDEHQTAQAMIDILHYIRPVREVQQEIQKAEQKREEQEREELLNMMEMTVGLSTTKKPEPEPAKPTPAPAAAKPFEYPELPKDYKPAALPAKQPEPAKKPEPAKVEPKKAEPAKKPEPTKKPEPAKADPKKAEPAKPAPAAAKQPEPAKPAAAPAPASAPAPSTSSGAGAGAGINPDGSIPCPVAGLPPLPGDWKIDDVTETHLPPGFPEAPPKVTPLQKGASEDEYKAWMKNKYERETWDNKLILYKIRMTNVLKSLGKM